MSNTATLRGHKGYIHAMVVGGERLVTGCAARMIKVREILCRILSSILNWILCSILCSILNWI